MSWEVLVIWLAALVSCQSTAPPLKTEDLYSVPLDDPPAPEAVGPSLEISLETELIFGRTVPGTVTGALEGDYVSVYVGRGEPWAGPCREGLCLEVSDDALVIEHGADQPLDFAYLAVLEEASDEAYLFQAVVWYPAEDRPYKSNLIEIDGRYLGWISVAAGSQHTCAIDDLGLGDCWGNSIFTSEKSNDIPWNELFVNISSSSSHNVGLTTDGRAVGWGENGYGQANNRRGPFAEVCGGGFHSCARDALGRTGCWGQNFSGQTDVPVDLLASRLSCGYNHSCLLGLDGLATCWGGDALEEPLTPLLDVASGTYFSCGLLASDSSVTCWGGNNSHEEWVAPAGSFTAIAAGLYTACAITADQDLACWGNDADGQIPKEITGPFVTVDVGGNHVCAIRTNGELWCWGEDRYQQVSDPPVRPQ